MHRRLLLAASLAALAGCASQTATPQPRTVVVFFTANSADLDPAANAAIGQAADALRGNAITAHVRGFAAPDNNSAEYNKILSQTRAQAVADALVNAGIARPRISMESRGSVAYDLMPVESRRVEIVIGP